MNDKNNQKNKDININFEDEQEEKVEIENDINEVENKKLFLENRLMELFDKEKQIFSTTKKLAFISSTEKFINEFQTNFPKDSLNKENIIQLENLKQKLIQEIAQNESQNDFQQDQKSNTQNLENQDDFENQEENEEENSSSKSKDNLVQQNKVIKKLSYQNSEEQNSQYDSEFYLLQKYNQKISDQINEKLSVKDLSIQNKSDQQKNEEFELISNIRNLNKELIKNQENFKSNQLKNESLNQIDKSQNNIDIPLQNTYEQDYLLSMMDKNINQIQKQKLKQISEENSNLKMINNSQQKIKVKSKDLREMKQKLQNLRNKVSLQQSCSYSDLENRQFRSVQNQQGNFQGSFYEQNQVQIIQKYQQQIIKLNEQLNQATNKIYNLEDKNKYLEFQLNQENQKNFAITNPQNR